MKNNANEAAPPLNTVYASSDINTLKIYRQSDGSERVYFNDHTWINISSNVVGVLDYIQLLQDSRSNVTLSSKLEELKVLHKLCQ